MCRRLLVATKKTVLVAQDVEENEKGATKSKKVTPRLLLGGLVQQRQPQPQRSHPLVGPANLLSSLP